MLALYIYIVLDRNKKQNFGNFFCVRLSDNPIWINGIIHVIINILLNFLVIVISSHFISLFFFIYFYFTIYVIEI